jgi:hypothetical protein
MKQVLTVDDIHANAVHTLSSMWRNRYITYPFETTFTLHSGAVCMTIALWSNMH